MTKKAMNSIFKAPTLWALQPNGKKNKQNEIDEEAILVDKEKEKKKKNQKKCDRVAKEVGFESVEMVLYPLGTGLLIFQIDWMNNKHEKK